MRLVIARLLQQSMLSRWVPVLRACAANNIVIGYCASASQGCSMSIGDYASTNCLGTAIGYCAIAAGATGRGIAIGGCASGLNGGIAIGLCASAPASGNGMAIGNCSYGVCGGIAIGCLARASGVNSVAIGYYATSSSRLFHRNRPLCLLRNCLRDSIYYRNCRSCRKTVGYCWWSSSLQVQLRLGLRLLLSMHNRLGGKLSFQ